MVNIRYFKSPEVLNLKKLIVYFCLNLLISQTYFNILKNTLETPNYWWLKIYFIYIFVNLGFFSFSSYLFICM